MKLEKFKEKKKINKVIIIVFLLLLITGGFILGTTYSKYTYETDKIPFINGKVKYSGSANGDVTFAFYQDGKEVGTMPKKDTGYMYDASTSKCDKEATIDWDNARWAPTVLNLNETKTSCEIHFNKRPSFGDSIILADQPDATDVAGAKTKIKAKSDVNFNNNATTDEGLHMAMDNLGESYYFRGNVTDNWVSFANLYWRIVRVNGDGTVRLIYNGTSASQEGSGTQITIQTFNRTYNNPMHVGYKYGTYDTTNNFYNNTTNSNMKNYLENEWFDRALGSFTDYLADGIFCNDRSIASGDGVSGTTYYGPYQRINSKAPDLICKNENDRFAMGTNVGNVKTNGQIAQGKPVGLITADEVMMAGANGTTSENRSFYLYTYQYYWTMSPSYFGSGCAGEWFVNPFGCLDSNYGVNDTGGVRAVINIGANVSVAGGNGTTDEPYTLYKFL